jgi:zinc protease
MFLIRTRMFVLGFLCLYALGINRLYANDTMPYTFHTLANGLTLVTYQVKGSRQAVVDTWFGVGSANESPTYNGMSHFLEHVMFKSAEGKPSFDVEVEKYGGYTNAATSRDYTHYYYVVPATQLKQALSLQLSMLFEPAFPTLAVKEEQPVVQEEIRRAKNAPFRALFDTLYSKLYVSSPTIAQTIAGPVPQIASFDAPKVRDYYGQYYFPKSANLLVASPYEDKQVIEWANAFFADKSIQAGRTIPPITDSIAWETLSPQLETLYAPTVPLPTILWAFPEPPATASIKERLALELYLYLLAGHDESALNQALLHQENRPAYAVGAAWTRHRFEGFSYIYTMTEAEHLTLAKQRIQSVLKDESWLSSAKLSQAKKAIKLALAQERSQPASYLNGLGEAIVQNTQDERNAQFETLNALTVEDVKDAHRALLLRLQRKTLSLLLLPETAKKTTPSVLNHSSRNLAGLAVQNTSLQSSVAKLKPLQAKKTPSTPTILHATSIGSFHAYEKILPASELLGVAWHFPLNQSTLNDKTALDLLSALWLKSPLNAQKNVSIQAYLDDLGVTASFRYGEDGVSLYFETTQDNVTALVQAQTVLLKEAQGFIFDEKAFENERQQAIKSIKQLPSNPQGFLQAHAQAILGKGLAVGIQLDEAENALNALTFESVQAAWQTLWQKSPVGLVMAGPEDAVTALKTGLAFSGVLKGHSPVVEEGVHPSVTLEPVLPSTKHVLKADQETTWFLWGWTFPSVQDKDIPALHLVQTYLGQGMSAVLFQEVREKRGLAYEVSSSMETYLHRGMMSWYAGVKPENVDKTDAIFQAVLNDLNTTLLSKQALDALKIKRLGRFDIALNTPEQWVTFAGRLLNQGLPLGYIEDYTQRLNAVTPSDFQRVVKTYLGKSPTLRLSLGKALQTKETKEIKKETPLDD